MAFCSLSSAPWVHQLSSAPQFMFSRLKVCWTGRSSIKMSVKHIPCSLIHHWLLDIILHTCFDILHFMINMQPQLQHLKPGSYYVISVLPFSIFKAYEPVKHIKPHFYTNHRFAWKDTQWNTFQVHQGNSYLSTDSAWWMNTFTSNGKNLLPLRFVLMFHKTYGWTWLHVNGCRTT